MKKQWLTLFTVLCVLACACASAGVPASLNQKMATRSGPGTRYTEELGTFPQNTDITVISQVTTNGTTWVQVEFRYNGRLYRAYTGLKRVSTGYTIPWESTSYTADSVVSTATAYYGPGQGYAARAQRVPAGTSVSIYAVEGSWALCEYYEGSWPVRAYISRADLRGTGGTGGTPVYGDSLTILNTSGGRGDVLQWNIVDRSRGLCVDYYGNTVSYAGHSDAYAMLVGSLPVMSYLSGIPCVQHTDVYSGPSYQYWRRYNAGSGYTYTGTADRDLHVYGMENGWMLIRYPSYANGGYRYGWVLPDAISAYDRSRVPYVSFAYLSVYAGAYTRATDDPDVSLQLVGTVGSAPVNVIALAFLDANRDWVLCEFNLLDGQSIKRARAFLPADGLTP